VPVLTYFFKDNANLTARYLEASRRHVEDLSALLGPYPFSKFATVENFFPTGFGFPGFTLLGSQVLRLPFIPETSLRHEIAHCWWGNGVLVDYAQGNWCEGLTTYVADYLAQEQASPAEARAYRLKTLRAFAALAGSGGDMPLERFGARFSPASQAVGYGKAMFVFHMARQMLGDEPFWAALRRVYADRLFRETGWNHFRDAFVAAGLERAAAERFFSQWLSRPGAPRVRLVEADAKRTGQGWVVRGRLVQDPGREPPFALQVPVRLLTDGGEIRRLVELTGPEAAFNIISPHTPQRLEADPDTHVFRLLEDGEIPATVNSLKGSRRLVAVVAADQDSAMADIARLLLDSLSRPEAPVLREQDVTPKTLADKDVLFLGHPGTRNGQDLAAPVQQQSLSMLDQLSSADALAMARSEASFAVYKDPRAAGRVMAFFAPRPGLSAEAAEDAARRITHYGKFSYLAFAAGRNSAKGVWEPDASPLALPLEVNK